MDWIGQSSLCEIIFFFKGMELRMVFCVSKMRYPSYGRGIYVMSPGVYHYVFLGGKEKTEIYPTSIHELVFFMGYVFDIGHWAVILALKGVNQPYLSRVSHELLV